MATSGRPAAVQARVAAGKDAGVEAARPQIGRGGLAHLVPGLQASTTGRAASSVAAPAVSVAVAPDRRRQQAGRRVVDFAAAHVEQLRRLRGADQRQRSSGEIEKLAKHEPPPCTKEAVLGLASLSGATAGGPDDAC